MKGKGELRLFMTVSALGVGTEDGRRHVVQCSYKKQIGHREKPLSTLFVPLMEEALDLCRWPSPEAMLEDLRLLSQFCSDVHQHELKEAEK